MWFLAHAISAVGTRTHQPEKTQRTTANSRHTTLRAERFSRTYCCWRCWVTFACQILTHTVCVFQPYELLLQQYFGLTVKYIFLNYLKTFSYIHMADKSQAFFSVWSPKIVSFLWFIFRQITERRAIKIYIVYWIIYINFIKKIFLSDTKWQ